MAKLKPSKPQPKRYLRAARVLIETGDGRRSSRTCDPRSLAKPSAGYCRDTFVGVSWALVRGGSSPAFVLHKETRSGLSLCPSFARVKKACCNFCLRLWTRAEKTRPCSADG
jgi:hypothetical protein